jgi:hypothetical protein
MAAGYGVTSSRYTGGMRAPARLRKLCLALPEATEVEQFGGPTYRVRNKIFAMQAGGEDQVWFMAEKGVQPALVESDPDRWFVPPYVGGRGWVGAVLSNADWDHLADLIEESYRLVAPKRLSKLL